VLLAQHTALAVLAVGLRQESAAAALPDRNDGQQSFSAACNSRPHQSRRKAAPTILDPRESASIRG